MSTSVTVTPSYVWTADSNGKIQPTKDRLNLTAAPTVVLSEDYLQIPVLTGTDDADGTGSMSIQITDNTGANIEVEQVVSVWVSTSDKGAPGAMTGFTVSTGVLLKAVTANAYSEVITDNTGLLVMDVNKGSAGTVYVMVSISGKIFSQELVITA